MPAHRRYTAAEIDGYRLVPLDDGHQVVIAGDTLGTIRRAGARGWSAHTSTGRTVAHRAGSGRVAASREQAVLDLLLELGL